MRAALSNHGVGHGHVFLAQSRLEHVVHDAAIVPTDRRFRVREYWGPVIGDAPEKAKPREWPTEFARSSADAPVWFMDVGDITMGGGASTLADRAVRAVAAISSSGLRVGQGRTKLRIAMPVLGVAGGGLGDQRGEVIRALIDALVDAAKELEIDVMLVTPSASVFSAAQHVRRAKPAWHLSQQDLARARDLAELIQKGHLALFLGAGVSVPAGLPTWGHLVEELAASAGLTAQDLKDLQDLHVLDQAELLSSQMRDLGKAVAAITARATRPSLAHALLAGFGCQEVVTTNYDALYETAVRASGRPMASVLPWQPAVPEHPWILKLHGDINRPESIVLTRRHFVGYDANTRPAGAMLQALLQTRHLLFVGASLNDDNVSRLVYEVDGFRRKRGLTETFGTYLDIDGIPARQALWSRQLEWIEVPGESFEGRARTMEVFLDAVAAYAATDAPWLLDKRFSGLLSDEERTLVGEARALHVRARKLGKAFTPLTETLKDLGAAEDPGAETIRH